MKIHPYVSAKLSWLSVIAMWMIVVTHSPITTGDSNWSDHVQRGITNTLTLFAVPLFFIISGVFFTSSYREAIQLHQSILKKKAKTLLVPYISWSVIGFVWMCLLNTQGQIDTVLRLGVVAAIDNIFGLSNGLPVGDPPLWFVRSLLIFFLAGALLGKIVFGGGWQKIGATILLIMVAVGWVITGRTVNLWGTPSSPFYFALGCVFSDKVLNNKFSVNKPSRLALVFGCIYLVLNLKHLMMPNVRCVFELVVRNFAVCACIGFLWFAYDCLVQKKVHHVSSWGKTTFFVYCFHFPFLLSAKNAWSMAFGTGNIVRLIGFLLFAIIVPAACIFIACWVEKLFPRCYSLLTGGRTTSVRA